MTKLKIKENVKKYGIAYLSDEELLKLLGKENQEYLDEYARRKNSRKQQFLSPADVIPYLRHTQLYEQEIFSVILLNGAREIIKIEEISKGTLSYAVLHARDVFRTAIKENASAIIISHNHPSGNTTPSEHDIETTKSLKEAGELLGIPILDHIIIGNDYYSFLEHNNL